MAKVFLQWVFLNNESTMEAIKNSGYSLEKDREFPESETTCFDVTGPDIPKESPWTVLFLHNTITNKITTQRDFNSIDESSIIPITDVTMTEKPIENFTMSANKG